MLNKNFIRKLDANGFSLLEVVASVVLISIILLSFSYLIINTLKTTKTSENIVDYTNYAQTEIEKIYALNSNNTTNDIEAKKIC